MNSNLSLLLPWVTAHFQAKLLSLGGENSPAIAVLSSAAIVINTAPGSGLSTAQSLPGVLNTDVYVNMRPGQWVHTHAVWVHVQAVLLDQYCMISLPPVYSSLLEGILGSKIAKYFKMLLLIQDHLHDTQTVKCWR